jgi:hypothetical protein
MGTDDTSTAESVFGPVISSYSRAEAIEDGVLVDVSDDARHAGIRHPVALTAAVYDRCVASSDASVREQRLWHLLWVLVRAVFRKWNGSSVELDTAFGDENNEFEHVKLVATCGPGDSMEPVVTVMFPGED